MRGSTKLAVLALSVLSLTASSVAPVFAQAAGQARPPAAPAPKPAAPLQVPAMPPAQAAPAAPPAPPAVFPAGAKVAFFNPPRVFQESMEGKVALARVNALTQKKQNEGAEKNKQLQANQQKLQTSGTLLSDAARTALEKEIEKEQVDIQRFQQDAQAEINELQNEVQQDFVKKVSPILASVAAEKGLHMVFQTDAGLAWMDPGLDLTNDIIKKLDATSKPGTAPK
ncbi:MAG: OmpH family outer membrane protein [Acidobacteria bacterium]|nr:OmpH family outer membrane protein [Acidobacteriota bacterium]